MTEAGKESASKSLEERACALADAVTGFMAREPDNIAGHQRELRDLKLATAKEALDLYNSKQKGAPYENAELIWSLGQDLPDFSTDALYQKRASLTAIAAAVFLGWLLGGLLSTFLGLFGLGGDIIRAGVIFLIIWLGEYLGANPRARKILLACLGMGALARFAAAAVGGFLRFTSFGGLRQLVFGVARPNIFKSLWLIIGAFFIFIFLAKKITALDLTAFRESLRLQVEQRLALVLLFLENVAPLEEELAKNRRDSGIEAASGKCPKKSCALAQGVAAMLDSMNDDMRKYFADRLAMTGFLVDSAESDYLVWNDETHAPLYDAVGLVRDGDRCRILKRAVRNGDKIERGHVQRAGPAS